MLATIAAEQVCCAITRNWLTKTDGCSNRRECGGPRGQKEEALAIFENLTSSDHLLLQVLVIRRKQSKVLSGIGALIIGFSSGLGTAVHVSALVVLGPDNGTVLRVQPGTQIPVWHYLVMRRAARDHDPYYQQCVDQ